MEHFLKIKCVDSRVNVHIFASKSAPFTLTTVQVLNLALTQETDYSALPLIRKTSFMIKSLKKIIRHVFCFKLCTVPASVMREMFGKGPSSSPSAWARVATPPISRLGRVAAPSNSRLGRVATPSSSRLGRVATDGVAARPLSRFSWPLQQLERRLKVTLFTRRLCTFAYYRCLQWERLITQGRSLMANGRA